MDELAAAAGVEAMTVDDVAIEYTGLEYIVFDVSAANEAPAVVEVSRIDKESERGLPVVGDARAADPKVTLRPSKQRNPPKHQPLLSLCHPVARSRRWMLCGRWPTACSRRARARPRPSPRLAPRPS